MVKSLVYSLICRMPPLLHSPVLVKYTRWKLKMTFKEILNIANWTLNQEMKMY